MACPLWLRLAHCRDSLVRVRVRASPLAISRLASRQRPRPGSSRTVTAGGGGGGGGVRMPRRRAAAAPVRGMDGTVPSGVSDVAALGAFSLSGFTAWAKTSADSRRIRVRRGHRPLRSFLPSSCYSHHAFFQSTESALQVDALRGRGGEQCAYGAGSEPYKPNPSASGSPPATVVDRLVSRTLAPVLPPRPSIQVTL